MQSSNVNWEKLTVYITIAIAIIGVIIYICDMKERIAKLEVKMEYEQKRGIKTDIPSEHSLTV